MSFCYIWDVITHTCLNTCWNTIELHVWSHNYTKPCYEDVIDQFHKSQNALVPYPTMLHSRTEMYTFLFWMEHCGIWNRCILGAFTNPRMHLFRIPQCSIQNRNVHISVLNGALWDMEQVHSGICKLGQLLIHAITSRLVEVIPVSKRGHRRWCLFFIRQMLVFCWCLPIVLVPWVVICCDVWEESWLALSSLRLDVDIKEGCSLQYYWPFVWGIHRLSAVVVPWVVICCDVSQESCSFHPSDWMLTSRQASAGNNQPIQLRLPLYMYLHHFTWRIIPMEVLAIK